MYITPAYIVYSFYYILFPHIPPYKSFLSPQSFKPDPFFPHFLIFFYSQFYTPQEPEPSPYFSKIPATFSVKWQLPSPLVLSWEKLQPLLLQTHSILPFFHLPLLWNVACYQLQRDLCLRNFLIPDFCKIFLRLHKTTVQEEIVLWILSCPQLSQKTQKAISIFPLNVSVDTFISTYNS